MQFGVAEPNFNTVSDAIFMRFCVVWEFFIELPASAARACIFSSLHLFGSANGWGNHLHFACETSSTPFPSEWSDFSFDIFNCSALRNHPTTNKNRCGRLFFYCFLPMSSHWISRAVYWHWEIQNSLQRNFMDVVSWLLVKTLKLGNKISPFNVKEIRNIIITIGPNEPKKEQQLSPFKIINFYSERSYYSLLEVSKMFWHRLLFIRRSKCEEIA